MHELEQTRKPVIKRGRRVRSRHGWILARKLTQTIALLFFLALFVAAQHNIWPASWIDLPMRLDPLLLLAHMLASRVFLLSSAIALLTIGLTLLFGRAWCGWLCPLGTILDSFPLQRWRKKGSSTPSESWRKVKYLLLIAIISAALLGNLTLLIFDPLTILFRTLSTSIWPTLNSLTFWLEARLYTVPALSESVSRLDALLRPALFPLAPVATRAGLLFSAILLAIILLNMLAPRAWCRYLCPLGGLLGLVSKAALYRRQVGNECKGCKLCTQTCPTGTIDPSQGYASDPSECTVCMECIQACPRSLVSFRPHWSFASWNTYDPGRREALLAIGAAIGGIALIDSERWLKRPSPYLLQPPGGWENNLLNKCVRCGECLRACPTSGLQPALNEAGIEGLWTPVLVPRLGYCDYACNACGQICPVQAIPALDLEQKRQQVIGIATIDPSRCIAYAEQRDCIVCEEMCPIADKAIKLENRQIVREDGTTTTVQQPRVLAELCIGCGICEYKCPVGGQAAIRVRREPDRYLPRELA